MRQKKGFKLEAKAGKGSASRPPFLYRILAWSSLALILVSAIWFWFPQSGNSPLISEPERKLRELSRENPDAEVFDLKTEKAEK